MGNRYFDLKVQIENNSGSMVDLEPVFRVRHYSMGLEVDEVPYVVVECMGNDYIKKDRKVIVSYSSDLDGSFSTYTNIFTGYIARLDDDRDYNIGRVSFRARNALSLITQRFFGVDTHYGDGYTLSYEPNLSIYSIPDNFNDVYSIEINGVEISKDNWNYDYLIRKVVFYKTYPSDSVIVLKGHINTSLKTIVENILDNAPSVTYNTIQDSGTFLETCFFDKNLSRYRALKQLAEIYNYRLFADASGNISFNPVKLNTATETATETDFISIEKAEINKSISKVIVNGAIVTSKFYQRTDDILDDFNDNSNANNFGGKWELSTDNFNNIFTPSTYRVSFERDNFGIKVNYNAVSGSIDLIGTLSSDGSSVDLSAFDTILIKYRSTAPINFMIDSAYYTLPANNYQELIEIPFTSFENSFTDTAVSNISIITTQTGNHEYFIDFIAFSPASATVINSYETERQLFAETGTSGGELFINLPFVKNESRLQVIADGNYAYFAGGFTQYDYEILIPSTFADIGDIVDLTESYYDLTAEPFEVITFDFDINATKPTFKYRVQEPYTTATINAIRNNDRISISAGETGGDFDIISTSGSSDNTAIEFSKELIEIIAQSKWNYLFFSPKFVVREISGVDDEIEVLFGETVEYYDSDYFNVNLVNNFGEITAEGNNNSVSTQFGHDVGLYSKADFSITEIKENFVNTVSGLSNQITITLDKKVSEIDSDFFTVYKF